MKKAKPTKKVSKAPAAAKNSDIVIEAEVIEQMLDELVANAMALQAIWHAVMDNLEGKEAKDAR